MKLAGDAIVLDTNIVLHWMRGKSAASKLLAEYGLGSRRPRPILPVVVKAEIKSLALQFNWGEARIALLDVLLGSLPAADIGFDAVIDSYARLDLASRKLGRRMGKNDLWIAAIAAVQGGVVLTTDQDFDHLNPGAVRVERIDVESLLSS